MSGTEVIDSEECARMLGCTALQVEEMARAGELPGLKIGRSWRFVRADLLAWLAEKARAEAEERRSKRNVKQAEPVKPQPRRRVPPSLAFLRAE